VQGKTNARVPGNLDNFGHCCGRDLHTANDGVPKKTGAEIDPRQEASFRTLAPGDRHFDCLSVGRRRCNAALAQKSHCFWIYRFRAGLPGLAVVLGGAGFQTQIAISEWAPILSRAAVVAGPIVSIEPRVFGGRGQCALIQRDAVHRLAATFRDRTVSPGHNLPFTD
jgi:hypothetical protein